MNFAASRSDEASDEHTQETGPGRSAQRPGEVPWLGWLQIMRRTWRAMSDDNVTLVSAGVAFFGLLSIVPAIGAFVALYGLVADPLEVGSLLGSIDAVPSAARTLLRDQLREVASTSERALGFGLVASVALALWSASRGMKALMTAMNIAYRERERRGFVRLTLEAYALTAGGVLFVIVALGVIVGVPALTAWLPETSWVHTAIVWVIRPLLLALLVLGFAVLYRFGPCRAEARWAWIRPGAGAAGLLWVAVSAGFSFYVSRFASYNETYGSLGAVVILLMWFYLSALIAIVGAELNAALEHQTSEDTTTGPVRPMGSRGAVVADTVPHRD